jgi:hypothetical protein
MFARTHLEPSPNDTDAAISLGYRQHVCAFVLLLFIVAATFSALRKDVTQGFDELAHVSYVAHVQRTGESYPDLNTMRMLDPASFRVTSERNYLSHPSLYYVWLARLGPELNGNPGAIIIHRLLNIGLAAIGFAALLIIAIVTPLSRSSLYVYVVPLACIPILGPLAGAVNNDNLAFAGGGIATLAWLRFAAVRDSASLLAGLGAIVIASWAKINALLLVGGLGAGVLAWTLWRGRFDARWLAVMAVCGLLAAAPYVAFFIQYGTPAPSPLGHIAMIKEGAQAVGWDVAARMTPTVYAVHFMSEFVFEWMPALAPRSGLNYAALAIPVLTLACAVIGVMLSVQRLWRGTECPADVIVAAAAVAFIATFMVHGVMGYLYHLEFGWLTSAYPRYYMPLAALVPLAGLSLLAGVKSRLKSALAVFLIAGPVLFRILGTPF